MDIQCGCILYKLHYDAASPEINECKLKWDRMTNVHIDKYKLLSEQKFKKYLLMKVYAIVIKIFMLALIQAMLRL